MQILTDMTENSKFGIFIILHLFYWHDLFNIVQS